MTRSPKYSSKWLALVAVLLLPAHLAAAAPKGGAKKPKKPATSAPAKKPGKGGTAAEAKRRLAAGTKAFNARKYDVAAKELEVAQRLSPQPNTLRMLGDAHYQLKDYVASHEAYEKLVADFGDTMSKADRAEAERALKSLDSFTSLLEITVDEDGSALFVDGRPAGKSPLKTPVRVTAGPHKVRATANAYDPVEQDVDAKAGETVPVAIRFVPEGAGTAITSGSGKIKVSATPSEATIDIDGKEAGTGTYEGSLSAGTHRVVVRAEGFKTDEQEVTIVEGQTLSRDVELEKGEGGAKVAASTGSSFTGLYGGISLYGALPLTGQVRQPCPPLGSCTTSTQFGGGAVGRFGYNFGVIGLELAVGFLGERHNEKKNISGTDNIDDPAYANGDIARLENFSMYSLGGFAGVGPRVTSHGDTFRFTFGATPGLALRKYTLRRETGGAILDSYRTGTSTTGFAVAGDISVLIGSTPGFKVVAGVFAMVDFTSQVVTPTGDPRVVAFTFEGRDVEATLPTPAFTMAKGAQLFVGPQLGIQFGH